MPREKCGSGGVHVWAQDQAALSFRGIFARGPAIMTSPPRSREEGSVRTGTKVSWQRRYSLPELSAEKGSLKIRACRLRGRSGAQHGAFIRGRRNTHPARETRREARAAAGAEGNAPTESTCGAWPSSASSSLAMRLATPGGVSIRCVRENFSLPCSSQRRRRALLQHRVVLSRFAPHKMPH